MLDAANAYLNSFKWAGVQRRFWVAECIPGVMAMFLVELNPAKPGIDPYVWVIVGDLPPAYLSTVYVRSPRAALDGYIAELLAWVEAVEQGKPIDGLMPINGAPTRENALALKTRISFLDQKVLPYLPGKDREVLQ